jgi:hypothetical protein
VTGSGVARRVTGAVAFTGRSLARIVGRVPGTVHATRAGAMGTTSALQTLPDSTLRGLAATSVGVGAGFYLARAPRLVVAAGVVPALVVGAAIILRPGDRTGADTEGDET